MNEEKIEEVKFMIWQLIVIAIVSYLLGSVNLSIILSKLMGKGDIRDHGSGNAGTTNTLRTLGKLPAVVVLIWDVLKGVISILFAKWIITLGNGDTAPAVVTVYRDYAMVLSSVFAVLGHNFPIYFGFRGGKGVATSLGVIIAMEWPIAIACFVFAVVMILLTRMVSVGSILVAILYPILTFFVGDEFNNPWIYLALALYMAASVLIRHRTNIKRILNGTENKLWKTKAEKLEEAKANKAENEAK